MINRSSILFLLMFFIVAFSFIACNKGDGKGPALAYTKVEKDTAIISAWLATANKFSQSNIDSMAYYTKQALETAVKINSREWEAKSLAVQSLYLRRKGDFVNSVQLGLDVVKIYDSLSMWKEAVYLENVIADIYKEMGGQDGTIEYLNKAIELSRHAQARAEQKNDARGIIASYNQQAITWRDLSQRTDRKDLMDTAFSLYEKGIALINSSSEATEELGKFYNNISQVYNEHYKNYPKALEFLYKAIAFNTERNNQHSLTYNYANMTMVYLNLGKLDSAKYYGNRMLALSTQLKAPYRILNAYNSLRDVYKKAGRYDTALYYRELSMAIGDSLTNVKKAALITESQTKYETGKKEQRITELDKMNTSKNQRLWLAFGLVAVFAVLIMVSVWQNRRLQKQKQQITEQSNRLQWMMKELHHRVKNNLQIVSSLLNLQTYRLKDADSLSAIKESQLRVQAMSLIHQRLYQVEDVSMVNFKLYLDDLVETLMRSYGFGADDFDLQIQVEKEFLDVDTVMPMGLLVNEIITNAFKYAYKDVTRPLLHIRLSSTENKLQLAIRDNGPGIVEGSNTNRKGFGKKLIEALSKQLNATWTISSSNGTAYHFTIPVQKDKAA